MSGLVGKAMKFARTKQGKQAIAKAQELAQERLSGRNKPGPTGRAEPKAPAPKASARTVHPDPKAPRP